jgi:hypothetical protein
LTFVTILVLVAGLASDSGTASTQPLRVLLVNPDETHVGGQLYISGSGFEPRMRENITFACPDLQHYYLVKNGAIQTIGGPVTDSNGNFVKFPFRFTPFAQLTAYTTCSVYASFGSNLFGVDIPGHYTIVPAEYGLIPCALHMCGISVHPAPQRVHAGLYDVITIQGGWGGALAVVRIEYAGIAPELQPATQSHELDWKGKARFKFFVPTSVANSAAPVAAKVAVRVRLGAVAGSSSGHFTVIR